ncbi:MAG: hypothetical protein HY904_09825 [Deltaproteobacteria bacterium]|nr:hypothetical protein [Deltaproteobacteria bacterium]
MVTASLGMALLVLAAAPEGAPLPPYGSPPAPSEGAPLPPPLPPAAGAVAEEELLALDEPAAPPPQVNQAVRLTHSFLLQVLLPHREAVEAAAATAATVAATVLLACGVNVAAVALPCSTGAAMYAFPLRPGDSCLGALLVCWGVPALPLALLPVPLVADALVWPVAAAGAQWAGDQARTAPGVGRPFIPRPPTTWRRLRGLLAPGLLGCPFSLLWGSLACLGCLAGPVGCCAWSMDASSFRILGEDGSGVWLLWAGGLALVLASLASAAGTALVVRPLAWWLFRTRMDAASSQDVVIP